MAGIAGVESQPKITGMAVMLNIIEGVHILR